MDTKDDAIKYFNELKVEWLDRYTFKTERMEEERKLDPLMLVICEILIEEIVNPILQLIEHQIGSSNITFSGFTCANNEDDDIGLYFDNPGIIVTLSVGYNQMINDIINEQKKTDAANICLKNYY
ncbi:hypothetical protein BS756_00795 [Staphylococcus sp. MB371]|uniref:hypothetical protein n=1 Tax=Mammaliicoccus sciuri TaxID=1296 RepID=UPI000991C73E|nr:hypothetical protein [Mammaliicoccus sciuri]OOV39554.1 hypothetical protein BS756_00795 [Staphylococcus sp. MB371]